MTYPQRTVNLERQGLSHTFSLEVFGRLLLVTSPCPLTCCSRANLSLVISSCSPYRLRNSRQSFMIGFTRAGARSCQHKQVCGGDMESAFPVLTRWPARAAFLVNAATLCSLTLSSFILKHRFQLVMAELHFIELHWHHWWESLPPPPPCSLFNRQADGSVDSHYPCQKGAQFFSSEITARSLLIPFSLCRCFQSFQPCLRVIERAYKPKDNLFVSCF